LSAVPDGSFHRRWLTPDPLGVDVTNPQSLNRYAYVLNNPPSLTDPLGLQSGCRFGAHSIGPGQCKDDIPGGGLHWPVNWMMDLFQIMSQTECYYESNCQNYAMWGGMNFASLLAARPGGSRASWWHNFTTEFFKLSGGPGNVPTCAGKALSHMADTLNPFTPGVSTATEAAAPVAQGVAINRSLAQTTAAIDEYIVQQGLTVPLRSSVVRNAISLGVEDAVALGTKVNVAVQTFAVDYAAFTSMLTTMSEARSGGCAAAFPVF